MNNEYIGLRVEAGTQWTGYIDDITITFGAGTGTITAIPDLDDIDCNQDGSITVTKDLGSDKSKSFTYSVKDEFDYEIWGGNMQFDANTCWGHELVW